MTTITKVPVTLSVDETETICTILRDYSAERWEHAKRSKSVCVREWCENQARKASDLEAKLVRRIYRYDGVKP